MPTAAREEERKKKWIALSARCLKEKKKFKKGEKKKGSLFYSQGIQAICFFREKKSGAGGGRSRPGCGRGRTSILKERHEKIILPSEVRGRDHHALFEGGKVEFS